MLPIVLVSFLVSSALALPTVQVSQYNINEIAPPRDNGRLVSSYIPASAFENTDEGDNNIYILTIQQIIRDYADRPDAYSQAVALGQTLAVLGELATGIPGNACEAAAVADAYADAVRTGNYGGVRRALDAFRGRLVSDIDLIVRLVNNPESVRYSSGPKGNCSGGGRRYQFEAAWDAVLASADASQIGLLNEQYCATRRLYTAFNIRSNNVGAAVTAAALPPVAQVFEQSLGPVAGFFRALANGANIAQAAANAKQAILSARVQL